MKTHNNQIPYVPSPDEKLDTIFKLVKIKPGIKTMDLGSGDGRIVIAMAKKGALAFGIENIEKYFRRSLFNIAKENLGQNAVIYHKDFWQEDLGQYDLITIYPMITIMKDLEKKLSKELKKGTLVITNGFEIPNWKIWKQENHIYVYKK
jgi:cyclopropane fatty-acyl-phospholipid synthase-like methyltransferase